MNLFIAEDEEPARERLVELLQRVAPQARVLGHSASVQGLRQWLATHLPPDVLLLDIQLADGLSLELFRDGGVDCPVVFTTAYDRFALQAFDALAVDYLLKPVAEAALARALTKARRLQPDRSGELARRLAAPAHGEAPRQRLLGRKGGAAVHVLAANDVAYLVSVDKLAFAVTADGTRYRLDETLADLEAQLDPARFFRASRQVLVSAAAVAHYSPAGKGRLRLQLRPAGADEVIVSQERAEAFREWLLRAPG